MINARAKKGITQKILAKRMKTKQSVISRLDQETPIRHLTL